MPKSEARAATQATGFDAAFEQFAERLAERVTESVIAALAEYDAGKQPAPELVSGVELYPSGDVRA